MEPLGGGEWSVVFGFRSGGREYVLRLGRYREDYEKDRVALRFAGPDLPVPEVLEVGEALGGVYSISARIHGDPLDRLSNARFRAALPSVFRMLDALRLTDVSKTSGFGMWGPDGDAPYASWRAHLLDAGHDREGSRTRGWRERLDARPEAVQTFATGFRALETLIEFCPEERYLVHSDIVGDNVRVRDGQVSGVVDWGNAMYGDFLYDLARLTFYQSWYPEMAGIDLPGDARAHYASIDLEVPNFEERLRACQIHIGLDALAYCAFSERWSDFDWSGQRMLELAAG